MVHSLGAGDNGAVWGNEPKAQMWRTACDIRERWELGGRHTRLLRTADNVRQIPAFRRVE